MAGYPFQQMLIPSEAEIHAIVKSFRVEIIAIRMQFLQTMRDVVRVWEIHMMRF